ncbi:hypothetical protein Tco_0641751 [Tanacetum coccineum]
MHAMMKFPTSRGIAALVPRTTAIFECLQLEGKQTLPEEQPKERMAKRDENVVEEEVIVNPAIPDQKQHPSGAETKNSWSGKKRSSDEGSRGMDQGRYYKAGAVSDLDLQSSSSEEGRRHLEDVHRLQEYAYKGYHQIQMPEEDKEKTTFYIDQELILCQEAIGRILKNARANLPKAGRVRLFQAII